MLTVNTTDSPHGPLEHLVRRWAGLIRLGTTNDAAGPTGGQSIAAFLPQVKMLFTRGQPRDCFRPVRPELKRSGAQDERRGWGERREAGLAREGSGRMRACRLSQGRIAAGEDLPKDLTGRLEHEAANIGKDAASGISPNRLTAC